MQRDLPEKRKPAHPRRTIATKNRGAKYAFAPRPRYLNIFQLARIFGGETRIGSRTDTAMMPAITCSPLPYDPLASRR